MKYSKNNIILKRLFIFLMISLTSHFINKVHAQVIIFGPSTANINDTGNYSVYINDNLIVYHWFTPGGTKQNVQPKSVDVTWTYAGSNIVIYEAEGFFDYYYGNKTVTVADSPPAMPPMPSITNNCGNTVLTRTTPPSGETYYWQSTSTGTSTSNSSVSLTRTSGTVYYLRSYKNSLWSDTRVVNYTVDQPVTWYEDQDGDGLGDPGSTQSACDQPTGYVSNNNDQCPDIPGSVLNNGCLDLTLSNENYIYVIAPTEPTTDALSIEANNKSETVTYFDGLGREMQTLAVRAGGNSEDIITQVGYDSNGRKAKEFLPYPETNNIGTYRISAIAETENYYITEYGSEIDPYNPNPYSERFFEESPLNRILEQTAPGESWKLGGIIDSEGHSNGHSIKSGYWTNTSTEVRNYEVTLARTIDGSSVTFTPTLVLDITSGNNYGYYADGELIKSVMKDENWTTTDGTNHTIEEFKDKQGRTILKRTYNNGAHDTYYVYDDYGNLTYVMPPKAEAHTAKPDATELEELCYQYTYDNRNRLIEKKLPGKDWEYIVYDNLDRPVLTQDSRQRKANNTVNNTNLTMDEWLFTKYDALGRVAYTGIFKSDNQRSDLQHTFNNKTAAQNYETKVTSGTGYWGTYYTNLDFPTSNISILTINYYDDYNFNLAGAGSTATAYGVTSIANAKGLQTGSRVRILGEDLFTTTVNYFDQEGRTIYSYIFNDYLNTTDIVENRLDFTGKVLESKTTHQKTGKTDIVTVDLFEYDHAGRLDTQTQDVSNTLSRRLVKNHYDALGQLESKLVDNGTQDGYKDIVGISISNDLITKTGSNAWGTGGLATKGSFSGDGYVEYQVTSTAARLMVGLSNTNSNAHYNTIKYAIYNTGGGRLYVYESGSYKGNFDSFTTNDVFRVERIGNTVYYKKNGNIFYTSTVSSTGTLYGDAAIYYTNKQIKDLKIVDHQNGLQKIDYAYTIRGWLKGINDVNNLGDDLFTFNIHYDNPTHGTALFNGNISQTYWRTKNIDQNKKWYRYSYDALNRIVGAYDNLGRYNVFGIQYDKNGNFKNLIRKGHVNATATSFGEMDNLTYQYNTSSNRLKRVIDAANDYYGFTESGNPSIEYTYDTNGNMITDTNKGITNILYNHLNLPTQVTINSQNINYIYNVLGVKQRKTVNGTTTDYAGNYIYENNNLQFFNHPEGYVTPDGNGGYDYVYQYKDHLGNIRLSYADSDSSGTISQSEIIEEKNYYPFGLTHKGYNNVTNPGGNSLANRWGFGSKELQDEDINGKSLEWYDFDARNYDAALGRWMNIDPLAEDYYEWSPYNFVYNSPLRFVDPTGMGPDDLILKGKESAVNKAVETINSGLGGDYASVDENGKVTLNVSRDDLKTDEQKGLFDVLSKPINSENDTTIKVVESDGAVVGGSFTSERVDIDDVNAFGAEDEVMNKHTVLAHEVNEQYEKQDLGNTDYTNPEGTGAHQNSTKVESTVNGGWERGNSTITDRSRTRVVTRERVGTRTYTAQSYKSSVKFTKNGKTRTSNYQVIKGNVVKRP